jgi:hypothetical protein
MKCFRRVLLGTTAVVVLLSAAGSTPANADIPVVDFAGLAEWAQSIENQIRAYALDVRRFVGEELSWATQARQLAVESQSYLVAAEQLYGFIHYPSLGAFMGILNMAGLGSAMPVNPYAVMGLVNGFHTFGGLPNFAGILGSLASISGGSYAANHVYTPTDPSWASHEVIAHSNGIAGMQGAAGAATTDLRAHSDAMQGIRDRLAQAVNPKDVQDAQAQIELEGLWTANEAAQVNAVIANYNAQRDAVIQRENERYRGDLAADIASSPYR